MIDDLRTTPLLSGLERAQLERITAKARRRRLSEGDWLFRHGDPSRHFFLVVRGQIRLFRASADGAEKVIEIVGPGQTFAEALTFLNAPRYPVSAAALLDTEVIAIDAQDFADLLRGSVDTCFLVLGALSKRLRALIGEIDKLTLHSARSRVAGYLLDHCPEDRPAFSLDVRKGVIASRLSIQPETFSRMVKQLASAGVISVQGAHVTIHDRAALIEMSEGIDGAELASVRCAPSAGAAG